LHFATPFINKIIYPIAMKTKKQSAWKTALRSDTNKKFERCIPLFPVGPLVDR